MAPPARVECSAPGCAYITPENLPTYEILTTHLQLHTTTVHAAPAPAPGLAQQVPSAKVDKRPRPDVALDMTEHDFRFFESEWELYKRATKIAGQTLVDELWSCMSSELKKLAFDQGDVQTLNTEALMMARIRSLAVAVLHEAVHTVHLHGAQQRSDESTKAFAARVRGIASNCQLQKKCTCDLVVSYLEETVYHVVLAGLRDRDLQEACTTQALLRNITNISTLVDFCTAKESGHLAAATGTVGAVRSAYKDAKLRPTQPGSDPPPAPARCGFCGGKGHSNSSRAAREKECRAFTMKCSKCEKLGHMASVCRSKPPKVAAVVEDKEVSSKDVTNGAVEYGFYAITSGSWDFPNNQPIVAHSPAVPTANRFSPLLHPQDDASPQSDAPAPTYCHHYQRPPPPSCSVSRPGRRSRWSRTGRRKCPPPAPHQGEVARLQYELSPDPAGAVVPARVPLCHMEYDSSLGWRETPPMDSPTLSIHLEVHHSSYSALQLPPPTSPYLKPTLNRKTNGVADSGAQMNILPAQDVVAMNIQLSSLLPVRVRVGGASQGSKINIIGALLLRVRGTMAGSKSTLQIFYVADNVSRIYLSLSCLKALGVLPPDFPRVAMAKDMVEVAAAEMKRCMNDGVVLPGQQPCTCPERALPPSTPPSLPCPATPDNLPQLKQYLLDRYGSSTFNCCEHQPLPLLQDSPPLQLHVDPSVRPVAAHVPAQVPLHWQLPVKQGLDRDCRLGVIERVPLNTPTVWQSRMVVAPKHDGSPRRTIDFKALNKATPRQTHHTQSPWSIVASIPENVLKSTFDAWHGYHSLRLAEEDREATSFITPWGRYRYKTCPQGVLSAGDAYTDRMDRLLADFERTKRCIDDNLLYDNTIEEQFFRSCQLLDKCGSNGVTLNPDKFQFAQMEVNFLGFTVTATGARPTTEYMDNILSFPTPASLTDVRSWFGAVAQVSYAFATCPVMQPFRHLLSAKVPFSWSAELDAAFAASKLEIVTQCREGVRSFNPTLPTCLATDWSRCGMGYWLCQKRCSCQLVKPGCCPTGWQTVMVGSRFCHSAEQNYAPIEGEAAAAAWGTEKCKFFLLGLGGFLLALDHMPLIPILADKELGDIANPRLMNQKVKLLRYRFTPIYIPGKLHVIPDAWSRRTDSPNPPTPRHNTVDMLDVTNVGSGYSSSLGPPSWVSAPTTVSAILQNTGDMYHGIAAALRVPPSEEECIEIEETEAMIAHTATTAMQDTYVLAAHTPIRMITWARLQEAASQCSNYQKLLTLIRSGLPESIADWPEHLHPYHPYRHSLLIMDDLILCGERPLVPLPLRPEALDHLHAAHSGNTTMSSRASYSLFWPNMRQDILSTRATCVSCTKSASSNPHMPPEPTVQPDFPFSHCCMDFYSLNGKTYLALVDRYTGWLSILRLAKDDSSHVIGALREYFARWGVAKHLTSDGASVFTSAACKDFFTRWGVCHRVSSAYYPRANKRSEVAVKSAKRLCMDNLGPTGQLDTDRLARALLIHRNTPDALTGLSPAMILFGRALRDHLPSLESIYRPRKEWRIEADLREKLYAKRHAKMEERLNFGAKALPALAIGDTVVVQDQSDPLKPGKWTRTGTIVDTLPHHSYMVMIHGSRAATQRNRKFIRKITPFHPMIPVHSRELLLPAAPHTHQEGAPADPVPVQHQPLAPPHQPHAAQLLLPADVQLPPAAEAVAPPPMPAQAPLPPAAPASAPRASLPAAPPVAGRGLPPAAAHRQVPVAQPGQDIITLLKQREAQGHVLSSHSY